MDHGTFEEVFGTQTISENTQEIAEPAEETVPEGANEQEAAEPAENEKPAEETEAETEAEADKPGDSTRTPKNAAYAAARRKAEAEKKAAVEKARAEAERYIDDAIKAMDITNEFTGEKITTRAELESYKLTKEQKQRREMAFRAGISESEFETFVNNLPEVRAAKKAAQLERQRAARARIDGEIAEITKLNPSIKTIEDLRAMPDYEAFRAKVEGGCNFIDAYRLLHMEELISNAAGNARRQAVTNAAGKEHLQTTETRGTGGVTVPRDVVKAYRMLRPNMSEAEIQKDYAKSVFK